MPQPPAAARAGRVLRRPADAEAAGFRACRRCHPKDVATSDPGAALVRAACARLDAAPERPLAPLARELGASPFNSRAPFAVCSASRHSSIATRAAVSGYEPN